MSSARYPIDDTIQKYGFNRRRFSESTYFDMVRVAMNGPNLAISEKIVITRRRLAETQATFATRFNVKKLTVVQWENGVSVPDREHAALLATLFQEVLKEEDPGQILTDNLQRLLPFNEPLKIELRFSPSSAEKVRLDLKIERKAS